MSKIKKIEPLTGDISPLPNFGTQQFVKFPPSIEIERKDVYLKICTEMCDQLYTEKHEKVEKSEERLLKKYLKKNKHVTREERLMELANYYITELVEIK